MSIVTKPTRARAIFDQYLQSEHTKVNYTYHINRFVNHNNLESWDSILELESKKISEMMEDYVIMFKTNGKSRSYTSSSLFAVQSFCDSNEKLGINWKKIRRLLGKKQRPKKTRPYTREEIKRMIHSTKSIKNKAVILFLSASGVRRGALPSLRIQDLKEIPHGCMQVTVYAEDNEEYITFINKEAADALNLLIKKRKSQGEIITEDSFVFSNTYKLQQF